MEKSDYIVFSQDKLLRLPHFGVVSANFQTEAIILELKSPSELRWRSISSLYPNTSPTSNESFYLNASKLSLSNGFPLYGAAAAAGTSPVLSPPQLS